MDKLTDKLEFIGPPMVNWGPITEIIPGHAGPLQFCSWVSFCCVTFPSVRHSLPWCEGGGLVQLRFLVWVPFPQVLEHLVQLLQLLHFPSTKENILIDLIMFTYLYIKSLNE